MTMQVNEILVQERGIRRLESHEVSRLSADEFGGLPTSMLLPPYARLAAQGKLFAIDMHAGTAKAPVVAAPTTSPEWGLYNASANESMVVIQASCTLKSGTLGLGLALMGAVAKGAQTAVAADYSGTIKNCLDGSQKVPDVWLTNNPTLIGGTPAWHVLDATRGDEVANDSVGSGLVAKVDGMLIAKPGGHMVAFELVGETGTTALFTVSFIVAMLRMRSDY